MNEEQAARILHQTYIQAEADRNQTTAIHLFGIRYADELAELSIREILERANMPASYITEIRKGMRLAAYVTIRD